jgi:hypothetical protein
VIIAKISAWFACDSPHVQNSLVNGLVSRNRIIRYQLPIALSSKNLDQLPTDRARLSSSHRPND